MTRLSRPGRVVEHRRFVAPGLRIESYKFNVGPLAAIPDIPELHREQRILEDLALAYLFRWPAKRRRELQTRLRCLRKRLLVSSSFSPEFRLRAGGPTARE